MSYTDPLIKELKGYTLRVTEEFRERGEITDSSNYIVQLCDTIERIFEKGCLVHMWKALNELAKIMDLGHVSPKSFTYLRTVDTVRNSVKAKTPTGKFRMFLRYCLVNKCLHVPVEVMVRYDNNLTWNWYDLGASILGNEILGEIFLSVLLQCSVLCFKLDLNNTRFLDTTLVLPRTVLLEFVPCDELGVSVTFIDDKALVVHVDEKSVAAEDDQIEVGDVLDELNGHILHSDLKGKLSNIMMKGKNRPVLVQLIKCRDPRGGSIYPPIKTLLNKANIHINEKENSNETKAVKREKLLSKHKKIRNPVNYAGSVQVGEEGHVKMIESAISEILKNSVKNNFVKVQIECHELGLKVVKESTGEVLTSSSFMEISSCGQTKRHPDYFGYIAGNNLCNLASKFTCHVFQTEYDYDIQNILQSIGEGFHRTHFAV